MPKVDLIIFSHSLTGSAYEMHMRIRFNATRYVRRPPVGPAGVDSQFSQNRRCEPDSHVLLITRLQ